MRSERILLLALAAALAAGCLLILLPFLTAMAWAAIIVYCMWPLYLRCLRYLRPSLAALLVTVGLALLVLIPLVHIGMVGAKEARHGEHWVYRAINEGLPPAPASLAKIPLAGTLLTQLWNDSAQDLGGNFDFLQPAVHVGEHSAVLLASALAHGLLRIVLALFIAYFFFLSGAQVVARIRLLLVRIMNENRVQHLLGLVASTVRGVVFGILGTAAMQGILYAIGFEVAGAPQALLLASFAGLISIVPAGATVVYVPLCLFMLAEGHVVDAACCWRSTASPWSAGPTRSCGPG